MDSHKKIGEFDPSKESWISYTERLGQFFIATDIDSAEKKCAILLSGAGPHTSHSAKSHAPWEAVREKFWRAIEVYEGSPAAST